MSVAIYTRNAPEDSWSQAQNLFESGSGVLQTQKFASHLVSLIGEVSRLMGQSYAQWQEAAEVFKNGSMGIIIPFAVSSTIDLGKTAWSLANRGVSIARREGLELAQKVAVSAQMISYSAGFFLKNGPYGVAGDVFAAFDDGLDAMIAGDNLCDLNSQEIENISDEAKIYLAESKKLHLLKLVKAVAETVVGVLGLVGLVLGSALVSPITMLAIAIIGSGLGLFNRVYKDNMTYQCDGA